jgi:hypothetical protein
MSDIPFARRSRIRIKRGNEWVAVRCRACRHNEELGFAIAVSFETGFRWCPEFFRPRVGRRIAGARRGEDARSGSTRSRPPKRF